VIHYLLDIGCDIELTAAIVDKNDEFNIFAKKVNDIRKQNGIF
jgi:hypothetical protein